MKENMVRKKAYPAAWACYYPQEDIRKESSSGGIFWLLAGYVIERSGVVFGVRWNEKWEAVHDRAMSMTEVRSFMGSRYVQSNTGNTYIQAKTYLEEGRLVLYSGTPCQIAGLKGFLAKEYDNLLTVDIICHGVPSPLVWERYLAEIRGKKCVTGVSFRDKTRGWHDFSIKISYKAQRSYQKSRRADSYLRGFLKNIDLRPSCYECPFKGDYRKSDLTLGDFWGVENYLPELDDDKGISLVIVQSDRGAQLWEEISGQMVRREIEMDVIGEINPAYIRSVKEPPERARFFECLNKEKDIKGLLNRMTGGGLLRRVAFKIRNQIR